MTPRKEGDVEAVRSFLDGGADVNARNEGEDTPLRRAAGLGHRAVVALPLDRGTDPKARAGDGPPLDLAAQEGRRKVVRLLRERDS